MEGLNILEVIQKYDHVSQRAISKETGLSLGMVNMLIKKFLKVGFLKAEKLNGNNIKYILTPKGSQVLLEKTVSFVKRSFEAVGKISEHVEEVLEREFEDELVIYVDGDYGEVYDIVADVARRMDKDVVPVGDQDQVPGRVLYLDKPSDENGIGVFEGFLRN
ncbi:winged helix-turn-helix transcriptional regulator [Fusibacter sp. JL216-2]|uniref:winged helix-turn-helix transcriptional regulator n=1 Tax=Fusibacter sp. JL216-2 TaxID=3071453 RepID=UPI003D3359A3